MSISPQLVKELREKTGVGMMDCKKALTETNGDIEQAIDYLRKAGQTKADKKSSRIAAEGIVLLGSDEEKNLIVILEINSETDFVAKDQKFLNFSNAVLECLVASKVDTIEDLNQLSLGNQGTVDDARKQMVAEIGENVSIRRFKRHSSTSILGSYVHMGRIAVVVELNGGTATLAKDIAMQVAANNPEYLDSVSVPKEVLEREKDILTAQALAEGKPKEIVEKMIAGRIQKFMEQITLLGQSFVKNPDISIEKLLFQSSASVLSYTRYELGEGIEKKVDNFVEEVRKQSGIN
jgi:elongation factor Ts